MIQLSNQNTGITKRNLKSMFRVSVHFGGGGREKLKFIKEGRKEG